jgi:tetratricopeptide (TPR) repeat protein
MTLACIVAYAPLCADASAVDVDDALARAEFAFYAREEGTLQSAIATLERENRDAPAAGRLAALGYAYWKLAQLTAAAAEGRATDAAERCVARIDEATDADPHDAVAFAIASACNGLLAGFKNIVSGALYGHRAAKSLEKARELDPRDPRVLLIVALSAYSRPATFGGGRPAARRPFEEAAGAFDKSAQDESTLPWGHAEALAWLGRTALEEGDALAAREALERALILAPQYADAREWLARVTTAR